MSDIGNDYLLFFQKRENISSSSIND